MYYKNPRKEMVYWAKCLDCDWEDENGHHDRERVKSTCPECGADTETLEDDLNQF